VWDLLWKWTQLFAVISALVIAGNIMMSAIMHVYDNPLLWTNAPDRDSDWARTVKFLEAGMLAWLPVTLVLVVGTSIYRFFAWLLN